MNYILSLSELQTLAAVEGADRILLPAETGALSREAAVEAVFRLTRRGMLTVKEGGFVCDPQVRDAVRRVILADRSLLVTDHSRTLPQLMCYYSPQGAAVTQSIPQRPEEYRLCACGQTEVLKLLAEEGYLPNEDAPIADDDVVFLPPASTRSLTELREFAGLRLSLDRLETGMGKLLNRAIVCFCDGADRICIDDAPALPWRQETLRKLLASWTGG